MKRCNFKCGWLLKLKENTSILKYIMTREKSECVQSQEKKEKLTFLFKTKYFWFVFYLAAREYKKKSIIIFLFVSVDGKRWLIHLFWFLFKMLLEFLFSTIEYYLFLSSPIYLIRNSILVSSWAAKMPFQLRFEETNSDCSKLQLWIFIIIFKGIIKEAEF